MSDNDAPRGFQIDFNSDLPVLQFDVECPMEQLTDKSNGRIYLSNGDIFYSPNCSRDVDVPLPLAWGDNPFYPKRRQENGRYNLWELDTSMYKKPAWWTAAFGWQAFVELADGNLDSSLLSGIRPLTSPYSPEGVDGYTLSPWELNEWLSLDKQVSRACQLLSMHYQLSSILPWDPWNFGYLQPHPRYGALKVCLDKARKWFVISLGRLSYLIAAGETRALQLRDYSRLKRLPWGEVLLQGGNDIGINRWWLDLLYETSVHVFVREVERAGAFIRLVDEPNRQPTVKWFCTYHIPVWYPWGSSEASLPHLRSLAPLPHQLQLATTFITQSPASPDGTQTSPILRPLCMKKMDEFFKDRALRNQRKLASETHEQRLTRLAREKNPPHYSAAMYVWRNNGHGEYEREYVPRRRRDEIWTLYDGDLDRMRYDSVQNEWDVCGAWGDGTDSDDDEPSSFYGDDQDRDDLPETTGNKFEHVLDEDQVPVNSLSGDMTSLPERFEGEILNVLSLYFGYTPLIPVPSAPIVTNEADRKRLCRSLGIDWQFIKDAQLVFERPLVAAGLHFFTRLASKTLSVSEDEWDLCRNNRSPVVLTPRFRRFRRVVSTDKTVLYMLDPKDRVTNWYLALKYASDVAVVSRLPPKKTELDIVEFLLENGIPFHTLAPTTTLLRTPTPFNTKGVPPQRPAHYVFSDRDYLAYRERCNHILKHPRARAALMCGGYMWRLAVSVVPWEAVLKGPSGWSTDSADMIVVNDPVTRMELLDDRLTEAEAEVLCGSYKCATDVKGQEAHVSWYMPPHLYNRSSQDHGRWTAYSERIFSLLDTTDDTEAGVSRQPKNKTAWKSERRGTVEIFKALLRVENTVQKLLDGQ